MRSSSHTCMYLLDMSVGANIVLSSIIACNASVKFRICRSDHCSAHLWHDHWSDQWYRLYQAAYFISDRNLCTFADLRSLERIYHKRKECNPFYRI